MSPSSLCFLSHGGLQVENLNFPPLSLVSDFHEIIVEVGLEFELKFKSVIFM